MAAIAAAKQQYDSTRRRTSRVAIAAPFGAIHHSRRAYTHISCGALADSESPEERGSAAAMHAVPSPYRIIHTAARVGQKMTKIIYCRSLTCRWEMLCRICIDHIQFRKRVLGHADYTAPTGNMSYNRSHKYVIYLPCLEDLDHQVGIRDLFDVCTVVREISSRFTYTWCVCTKVFTCTEA